MIDRGPSTARIERWADASAELSRQRREGVSDVIVIAYLVFEFVLAAAVIFLAAVGTIIAL